MPIIKAVDNGLACVRTYYAQAGSPVFLVNLGGGIYRVTTFIKCSTSAAATRIVNAQINHAWTTGGGPSDPLAGGGLTCTDATVNRTDTFTFCHDGSANLQVSVVETVAGVGDLIDLTLLVEKLFDEFNS
jgi:hypothetical protein